MKNALIILNWNGWHDTLEFLDTVKEQVDEEHTVFIFDNGSTDESADKISDWFHNNAQVTEIDLDFFCSEQMLPLISNNRYILIKSAENYGFAKSNNMVIRQALKAGFEYITLCNNDVIMEPNALSGMMKFMDTNKHFGCSSCRIHYYDKRDTVWHAGGFFTFYGDVLIYSSKKIDKLQKRHGDVLTVSLITGCYFMCRSSVFQEQGLLTEDFFFGGEDINFCARLNKAKIPMGINLSVVIYHKINASINKKGESTNYKHIIHFTNRMIDISNNMGKVKIFFYRPFYLLLLTTYFSGRYKSPLRALTIVGAVRRCSKKNSRVSKELFEEICKKYS